MTLDEHEPLRGVLHFYDLQPVAFKPNKFLCYTEYHQEL